MGYPVSPSDISSSHLIVLIDSPHIQKRPKHMRSILEWSNEISAGPGQLWPASKRYCGLKNSQCGVKQGASAHPGLLHHKLVISAFEQCQHALWQLIGLRQHRGAGLLQNLRFGQIGSFSSEVSIFYA